MSQCHRPGGLTEMCPPLALEARNLKPRCPRGWCAEAPRMSLFHALSRIRASAGIIGAPWPLEVIPISSRLHVVLSLGVCAHMTPF